MCVYTQVNMHTYIMSLYQLRGPYTKNISVARSTPIAQILVSNTILK